MFKRIVIKLSGEALAEGAKDVKGSKGLYNKTLINVLVDDIIKAQNYGGENSVDVTLVIGAGNIWRGSKSDIYMDRVKADQMGMLATVINSIYVADIFVQKGVKSVVMTPHEIQGMTELYSKDKANKYLEEGYIIIFAAGLGHPYFSTDTIPALRACELDADCILFAKNIDGVYNKDPFPAERETDDMPELIPEYVDRIPTNGAKRFEKVTYRQIIKDNLKAFDLAAMVLCEENNIPSIVFNLSRPHSIINVCSGNEEFNEFGTKIIIKE